MIGQRQAMRTGARGWLAALTAVALAAGGSTVGAQDPKKPSSAVGGTWETKQQTEQAVAGVTLDAKQLAAVQSVSSYFNAFQNLKGNFVQTNAEKKRERGKFYVKRPGKLRFDYALPSKQLIVSDGQQLAIQDWDLGTDDRIGLDQTPFRILLRKDVDLLRDARILDVQEADDLVILTVQDKSPDAPGKIKLFLSKSPQLELKEWVMSDAQGHDTRVEVSGLVTSEDIEAERFKIQSPSLKRLQ